MLIPVIQEETTGCGIAAVANIVGKTYTEMKSIANELGIYADDTSLWSDTQHVRQLLRYEGLATATNEAPFHTWDALPNVALLAIKYREEQGRAFWHWVVFKRFGGRPYVLDSASYLPRNVREDFDAMMPKWFIEVIVPHM